MKASRGPALPYDAEVAYVHVPSGGWFDTGWGGFDTLSATMSAKLRVTRLNAGYDTFFGAYGSSSADIFGLRRNGTGGQLQA